jgi:adenylate kinase family enzyme
MIDVQNFLAELSASRRILVLGSSGSGKTTLSCCLAPILDLPLIHLDAMFWQPGWIPTPEPQWRATVASLAERESWIMDGMYEATLDLRIPAADTVILVESTRLACLWRVIRRKITIDDANRPDAPPGQPLDRDFLRYIWRYPAVTRPYLDRMIRQHGPDKKLIMLRSPRDIRDFLQHAAALKTGIRSSSHR